MGARRNHSSTSRAKRHFSIWLDSHGNWGSNKPMRYLWFGGSFNPIHFGHLVCARGVAESAGFDRVVLLPSGQSPHKTADASMAEPHHRVAMCQAAVAGDPLFAVDGIEMRRAGPSYTIDSVRELKQRGFTSVAWLIGADMVNSLPTWHEPANLLAEVDFVLMARPGWSMDWSLLPPEFRGLQKNVVPAPQLDISSTQIRDRLARGQSIRYLTSEAVVRYISEQRLYVT